MSTNYYFRNKEEYNYHLKETENRKNIISGIMETVGTIVKDEEDLEKIQEIITDFSYVGYSDLHIGKRSAGWKPLFRKTEYYSSIDDIKEFYHKNMDKYDIVSQYDEILTWEQLVDDLIKWPGERTRKGSWTGLYLDKDGNEWYDGDFS